MDPLFDLEGRVAVVTGGMGQLGIEYCCALVARGVKVAVFDLSDKPKMDDLRFVAGLDSGTIVPYTVDITEIEQIRSATQAVTETWKAPAILINNAALDSPPDAPQDEVGPFETYPVSSFDQVMDVNVKGTFLCCQVVGAGMAKEGRGSIINISSVYGLLSPRQDIYEFRRSDGETYYKPVAYSVSKSAVLNLTRYLATYWAKSGVHVNTLTLSGVYNNQPQEFLDAYCPMVPMGRMAQADDIIGAIIFLASDASRYMTGSNLIVDGGYTAW